MADPKTLDKISQTESTPGNDHANDQHESKGPPEKKELVDSEAVVEQGLQNPNNKEHQLQGLKLSLILFGLSLAILLVALARSNPISDESKPN
ncbi:MAG: hypothetical protein L6R37_008362 [Teloschistes peruensis]|nr:MAG: hypothetical protein L6R37_008362 [Teloschistes peruensis]